MDRHAPNCLHCDIPTRKATGGIIFPRRPDLRKLIFWVCVECGARCGCHKKSSRPLGLPTGESTRQARSRLHKIMDPYWQNESKGNRGMRRAHLYRMLRTGLGLPDDEAHVGRFSIEQCVEAEKVLVQFGIVDKSSKHPIFEGFGNA
ncbi:MAG: hypothetical protein COA78_14315 [Blastopirellula sp.]|nr:MAG: hypothetical protein COA78_14315 [Blastopirellula sp.]